MHFVFPRFLKKKSKKTENLYKKWVETMINKKMLSLDLGTKTGFCISDSGQIIKSGTKFFKSNRDRSLGGRFVRFRDWLNYTLDSYKIEKIVYEQVYGHTGVEAAHIYGGFLYHMAAICFDKKIELESIGVCTIKKLISGNGRATKQEVINAVTSLGFNPIDDNEADAIAIMCCFLK